MKEKTDPINEENYQQSLNHFTKDEDEFNIRIKELLKTELRFRERRGIRSRIFSKIDTDELFKLKDLFESCEENIIYHKDDEGNILGWTVTDENISCEE